MLEGQGDEVKRWNETLCYPQMADMFLVMILEYGVTELGLR
jgi:hypothetical protein